MNREEFGEKALQHMLRQLPHDEMVELLDECLKGYNTLFGMVDYKLTRGENI